MKKRSEFLNKIKRPIPYYGSKEKIAPVIVDIIKKDEWTNQYIEPFVGSNSIILHDDFEGIKVILNDFDGKITNIWRALKYKPDETAGFIQGVCNTINLTGLDLAVQRSYDDLLDRLHADIDYCDPKVAAHFMDLCCSWIGCCAGNTKGPWTTIKDDEGIDIFVRKEKGEVGCQQAQYSNKQNINTTKNHTEWFSAISKRLSDAYILSHDFERILNLSVIKNKRTTIFFDPPYDKAGDIGAGCSYISDEHNIISKRTREWCIKNHNELSKTRIIVAGRGKEHDELLNYGYEKIDGINLNSLNKIKTVTDTIREHLWVKYESN